MKRNDPIDRLMKAETKFQKAELAFNKAMQVNERLIMSGKYPTHGFDIRKRDERIRKLGIKMDAAKREYIDAKESAEDRMG